MGCMAGGRRGSRVFNTTPPASLPLWAVMRGCLAHKPPEIRSWGQHIPIPLCGHRPCPEPPGELTTPLGVPRPGRTSGLLAPTPAVGTAPGSVTCRRRELLPRCRHWGSTFVLRHGRRAEPAGSGPGHRAPCGTASGLPRGLEAAEGAPRTEPGLRNLPHPQH